MAETRETTGGGEHTVYEAWRFLCDASYAIWPRDVAHQLGELQKTFWGGLRWLAEKNLEWTDECIRGGDRLREEWQRRHQHSGSTGSTATGARPPADVPPDHI